MPIRLAVGLAISHAVPDSSLACARRLAAALVGQVQVRKVLDEADGRALVYFCGSVSITIRRLKSS